MPLRDRPARSFVLPMVAAGLAVAVALPLTRRGWLLLLDWVPGPHPPVLRSVWGLDGGLLASLPSAVAWLGAGRILGHATVGWVPVALGVALSAWTMGRLVGGPPRRQLPASLLYAVNPVVYERLFVGQLSYLLAYALLPLALRSILRAARPGGRADLLLWPALWATVLISISVHFLWILAVVGAAVAVTQRPPKAVPRLVPLAIGTALTSCYFIIPLLGRPAPVAVGSGDLTAFRTTGDPQFGLFANLAALYGFWRQEPRLPKGDVPGWPFFLAAVLLVAAVGAYRARRVPEQRPLVRLIAVAGFAGYLLALGDQGPTGPIFRWLFFHVPGFAIMREPQKFVALVALAYAVLFGLGAEVLVSGLAQQRRRFATAVAVGILPLCYTPTLFFGLAGRISVSHYPASWAAADRLMGSDPGKVLFLPWHQYLSFPFTNRVIANPADGAFRRDVIVGDNVELAAVPTASRSPRSAYLEFLYRSGPGLCSFGDLLSPLGVEFVLLAKTVDWQTFSWLDRQVDLAKVSESEDLVVYRNLRYSGIGWRSDAATHAQDWSEVVGLSRDGLLSTSAVVVDQPDAAEPPATQQDCRPPGQAEPPQVKVIRRSPVTYAVPPGTPGMVVLSEPFDPTWRLEGQKSVQLAGGVTGLPVPPAGSTARFGHWNQVRLGYVVSASALAALITGCVVLRRRGRSGPSSGIIQPGSLPGHGGS